MIQQKTYAFLLLLLIQAAFFHIQSIVLGITAIIILMPLKNHFVAVKAGRLFLLLLFPLVFGLMAGFGNNSYLIFKDIYYFTIPLIFITCGVVLACRLSVEIFLKTLVFAGVIGSFVVTGISVSYIGFSAFTDPYAAHYAQGIIGTPGPPVAVACLLLSQKFNIKLFNRAWFNTLVAINVMGVYMFASRTYLIITLCFLILLVADKVKKLWIAPVLLVSIIGLTFIPFDALTTNTDGTFVSKLLGSFSEISLGQYNNEQDINLRYRGYESLMALKSYNEGGTVSRIFGELGKLIDVKTFVRLGEDTDFQYIPVLHNGWLYILVKVGIAGLLTYALVFISLIIINWRKYAETKGRPAIRLFAALTLGCIISLLLTNYIVNAFFNVEMSVIMITLGYSYLNFQSLTFKWEQQQQATAY